MAPTFKWVSDNSAQSSSLYPERGISLNPAYCAPGDFAILIGHGFTSNPSLGTSIEMLTAGWVEVAPIVSGWSIDGNIWRHCHRIWAKELTALDIGTTVNVQFGVGFSDWPTTAGYAGVQVHVMSGVTPTVSGMAQAVRPPSTTGGAKNWTGPIAPVPKVPALAITCIGSVNPSVQSGMEAG